MKKLLLFVFCSLSTFAVAQTSPEADGILPLDPALGISTIALYSPQSPGNPHLAPAQTPTLTVFRPQHSNGSAIVIAPGGAYLGLASNLEGAQVAEWFAARGFTAFVLRYRLGSKNLYPTPLEDAQRALRLVRSLSKKYLLVPNRVGIAGFSAGGHLAAITSTNSDNLQSGSADPVDKLSARPDFVVLGYPWLNAMEPQQGSQITYCSVLRTPTPQQCAAYAKDYTPRLHVSRSTPPTFIFATSDDALVPARTSVEYYQAMLAAGAPVELHLFKHGAHGAGLGSSDAALDLWPVLLEAWLRDLGLLTSDPGVVAAEKNLLTRQPGEPLTLDLPVSDILADPAGVAAVDQICGPTFMEKLPKEAAPASLNVLAPYFPKQLTPANLQKIAAAFQKLPTH